VVDTGEEYACPIGTVNRRWDHVVFGFVVIAVMIGVGPESMMVVRGEGFKEVDLFFGQFHGR